MKNKIKILITLVSTSVLSITSFMLGSYLSRKKYSPKKIDGGIYIDYTEDENKPGIYLSIDQSVLKENQEYVVLKTTHIRK